MSCSEAEMLVLLSSVTSRCSRLDLIIDLAEDAAKEAVNFQGAPIIPSCMARSKRPGEPQMRAAFREISDKQERTAAISGARDAIRALAVRTTINRPPPGHLLQEAGILDFCRGDVGPRTVCASTA